MWDDQTIMMLLEGTRDTLYMTLVSTFFGYVLVFRLEFFWQLQTKRESVQMPLSIKFWMLL